MNSSKIDYGTMTVDAFLELLPQKEKGNWEWKGRKLLDPPNEENKDKFRDELARQISGFANADGGIFVYGLENNRHVSGCLEFVGQQPIDDWVGRAIPTLVHPRVAGVEVHVIPATPTPGKPRLLVVEVPASTAAPHRSEFDKHYYMRFHDGTEIAPHSMVEWLFRRPTVCVPTVTLIPESLSFNRSGRNSTFVLRSRCVIENASPIIGKPVGLAISVLPTSPGWFFEVVNENKTIVHDFPYIFPRDSNMVRLHVTHRWDAGRPKFQCYAEDVYSLRLRIDAFSHNHSTGPSELRFPFSDSARIPYPLEIVGLEDVSHEQMKQALLSAAIFVS